MQTSQTKQTKRVTREFIRQLKRALRAEIAVEKMGDIFLCIRTQKFEGIWRGPQRLTLERLLTQDRISIGGYFTLPEMDYDTSVCANRRRLAWLIKNEKRWLEAAKAATI